MPTRRQVLLARQMRKASRSVVSVTADLDYLRERQRAETTVKCGGGRWVRRKKLPV